MSLKVGGVHVLFQHLSTPDPTWHNNAGLFFFDINGDASPFANRFILVVHGSGDVLLRMDRRWFTMVEDDAVATEVKMAANCTYHAFF